MPEPIHAVLRAGGLAVLSFAAFLLLLFPTLNRLTRADRSDGNVQLANFRRRYRRTMQALGCLALFGLCCLALSAVPVA